MRTSHEEIGRRFVNGYKFVKRCIGLTALVKSRLTEQRLDLWRVHWLSDLRDLDDADLEIVHVDDALRDLLDHSNRTGRYHIDSD